jgi:tetratricopeptide (TPR) repeat protein
VQQQQPLSRRELVALAVVLVAGMAVRGVYWHALRATPDYAAPLADAAFHDYWARALVTGDWTPPAGEPDPQVRTSVYLRPPGYPWFLAGVYAVSGAAGYDTARGVQFALGLGAVLLTFSLGRRIGGGAVGVLAAAWLALHWAFIYYEGELQEAALVVLLGLLLALLAMQWHARPTWWRVVLAGAVAGMLALVRPNALALVPVLALWALWQLARQSRHRAGLAAAGLLIGAAGACVAPVTLRNWRVASEFVPIAGNGAINFYIGNNPRADGYTARIPELTALTGQHAWSWFRWPEIAAGVGRQLGRTATHGDVAAYFRKRAWGFVRDEPERAAALLGKRALLFWGPAVVPNNKEVGAERVQSPLLRWLPGFPIVAALGLVGLVAGLRRPAQDDPGMAIASVAPPASAELRPDRAGPDPTRAGIMLLGALALVWFVTFVPILAAERFRAPVAAWLAVPLGLALVRIREAARARRGRTLAAWCAAAGGALVLTNWTFVPVPPALDVWHMGRGDACAARGRYAEAATEYRAAVAARPNYVAAREALGLMLVRLGRTEEATAELGALASGPSDDAGALVNLARAQLAGGQRDAAAASLRKALASDPNSVAARIVLGQLAAERGDAAAAEAAYQDALHRDPQAAEAHYELGLLRLVQRNDAAAEACFRAARTARPDFVEAHVNYGILLAKRQEFDAAIAEYRAALITEPTRFEALLNLAAALGAKGRIPEARTAIEAALRQRPDDAQALGLLRAMGGKGAER